MCGQQRCYIFLAFYIAACRCSNLETNRQIEVPKNFKFGVAVSAVQTEGAWNVDGKTDSIWDVFSSLPNKIIDKSTPDDACKSYQYWQRDVQMVKHLGVNIFRFSISWPRLLPTGYSNYVNPKALEHYNDVINTLIAAGIEPAVTIYHWDLPQNLQDLGGWANDLVADWLEDYARVLFDNFGDRVKTWFTVCEPYSMGVAGYGTPVLAPGINAHGFGEYITIRNILMAHARVYHLYSQQYRARQKGMIGIVSLTWSAIPSTNSPSDFQAARDSMDFFNGIYLNPIFSEEGGFPERVIELVGMRSAEQGYSRTRFPQLTNEERAYIKGTSDFLGMNYYQALVNVSRDGFHTGVWPIPSLADDLGLGSVHTVFMIGKNELPTGFRDTLLWIKTKYNNPRIMITENGYLFGSLGLEDPSRLEYIKKHLYILLETTSEHGLNMMGYIVWALMDDFEWSAGYTSKQGFYEVDFKADNRTRTLRLSGCWYRDVIATRKVDLNFTPKQCAFVSY